MLYLGELNNKLKNAKEVVTIPLRFKIIETEEKISSCLEESSGISSGVLANLFFRNFCAQTRHSISETNKIDKKGQNIFNI